MNSRLLKFGVPLLVAVLAVWLFFTPHLALRSLRTAAEARDAEALSAYINYPVLKENLKDSLNAKLLGQAAKGAQDNPFAGLGVALASVIVGPMVEAMVTPQALAEVMKGQKPRLIGKPEAAGEAAPGAGDGKPAGRPRTTTGYEGLNRFVVTITPAEPPEAEPLRLVFQREGLATWKLTAIRLP